MTCRGLARFVARWAGLAFSRPARVHSEKSTGSHGPAPITEPKSKRNGANTLALIESRAKKKAGNNRGKVVKNYRRVHQTLAKGSCSDGQTS